MRVFFTLIIFVVTLVGCQNENVSSLSCTGACLEMNGQPIVTKSYEWNSDHGQIYFNKQGVKKSAFLLRRALLNGTGLLSLMGYISQEGAEWTAKYASLTFSQIGRSLTIGGINEHGLIVESLVKSDTSYPATDGESINELQWVQYQLDMYKDVGEVLKNLQGLNIVIDAVKLHYLVCDRTGMCAVVEFDEDGKVFVTQRNQSSFRSLVVTNHSMAESRAYADKYKNQTLPTDMSGANKTIGAASSLNRFWMADQIAPKVSSTSISEDEILEKVSSELFDRMWIEDFTRWNVVYDPVGLKLYMRSSRYREQYLSIDFDNLKEKYNCKDEPDQSIDLYHAGDLAEQYGKKHGTKHFEASKLFQSISYDTEFAVAYIGASVNIWAYLSDALGANWPSSALSSKVLNEILNYTTGKSGSFECGK